MSEKTYPCLWFDGQAKAAAQFYCSVFPESSIIQESPMVVNWVLNGQRFMGLNGGPMFKFNEACSFVVECANQTEIDHYWNSLIANGGQESQCGWLKDQFGVSWQIIPAALSKIMSQGKGQKVMEALLKMRKLVIADLEAAANS